MDCHFLLQGIFLTQGSNPGLLHCRQALYRLSHQGSLPSIRVFSNESALCIRWPKYWSFNLNISPSKEHSGLIFFRMDWLDLLAVQGNSQESSPTPQFKSINSSALSFLYSPTLTSIHDQWKNHNLNETDLCWQSNMLSRLVITLLPRSKRLLISWFTRL